MIAVPTNYKVTAHNVHIEDSWRVSKRDFQFWLDYIRHACPASDVWSRKDWSLKFEWAVHNALHAVGYKPVRTGSVDLNQPQKWYVNWAYNVFGFIVYPFVK